MATPDDILRFWLGDLDEEGFASAETTQRWFKKDPAFDEEICARFGDLVDEVVKGAHDDWLATPRGRLAAVIALDQLPRNMFRDHAGMYANDARAVAIALEGIERGDDKTLLGHERVFLYMPLMHSEELAHQERCVELFEAFVEELQGAARERVAFNLKYAVQHRDIVARWGRFPHRNAILGRPSTPEEAEFLKTPGSSF